MLLGCPISTSKVWKIEKEIDGKELNLKPKSYGRMKIYSPNIFQIQNMIKLFRFHQIEMKKR